MICLTGDVHHDSLKTNEQLWLAQQGHAVSEVEIAAEYSRICQACGVKCTLYTTGRTLADQWPQFASVAETPCVEVAGHTYGGLPRTWWSRLGSVLRGRQGVSHANSHGSIRAQRRDIERMMAVARKRLGKELLSWRSHGLVHDTHTYSLLKAAGIQFISDELNWDKVFPWLTTDGLISHPLNTIMDHDHIYHAHRTGDYVARQQRAWPFADDPTSASYTIEDWGNLVTKHVQSIEEKGGVATLLLHPICMYAADEFATMKRLLGAFSRYQSIWACETGHYLQGEPNA